MAHMTIELALAAGAGGLPVAPNGAPIALAPGLAFHARPGDLLQGNLVLHTAPNKDLSINSSGIELYFRGFEHTSITVRVSKGGKNGGTSERTSVGGGDLCRLVAPTVPAGKNEHIFNRGTVYKFPFAFQVPPQAPKTTMINLGWEGTEPEEDNYPFIARQRHNKATAAIRYEIKSIAHVSGIFTSNLIAQTEIIIDPIFPVAPMASGLVQTSGQSFVNIPDYCCCECFGFKTVTGTVTLPKVALTNGEQIPVGFEIKNDSDAPITSVTIAFQNSANIRTTSNDHHFKNVTRFITVQRATFNVNIAAHSQQTIPGLSILAANLTPDLHSPNLTCVSTILVKAAIRGTRRALNVRVPLHPPYAAGNILVPIANQPAQASYLPGPPLQQSMGFEGQQPQQQFFQQQQQPQPHFFQPPPQASAPPPPSYSEASSSAMLKEGDGGSTTTGELKKPLLEGQTTKDSGYGGTAD